MARESFMDNRQILEAALSGYQAQLNRLDEAMAAIRSKLGIRASRLPAASADAAPPAPRRKRRMSAAARKRIGEATRKRWEAFRAAKTGPAKTAAKPKRKISAEGKARIIAATKKRWAAFHKAQKAAAKKMVPKAAAATA